jgi:hypothetical protein
MMGSTPIGCQEWNGGVGGGVALPIADWSNELDFGLGGEGYGILTFHPQVGFVPGVGLWWFWGHESNFWIDIDWTYLQICPFGDIRYSFVPGRTTGFIQGGLGIGINTLTCSINENSDSDTDVNPALRFGGGVRIDQFELAGTIIVGEVDMLTIKASFIFD